MRGDIESGRRKFIEMNVLDVKTSFGTEDLTIKGYCLSNRVIAPAVTTGLVQRRPWNQ
jgi:hypothetical protein